jgi:mannose-6-phosphate isomerase-like protein (cupin superfamily)
MTLLVADTTSPAVVWGVHGSPGRTWWKAFATRPHSRSPIEASEWACLPPSGVSGEHLHSRTEEIYIALSGRGTFLLNGERHPFRPGSVGLTTLGNVHGLVNTGEEMLEWWVIETIPPVTEDALKLSPRPRTDADRPPARVHHLEPDTSLDMAEVFTGPLQRIERRTIEDGDTLRLGSAQVETFVYVTTGVIDVSDGSGTRVLAGRGTSVMQQGGGEILVTGRERAEAYIVFLSIPDGDEK